MIQVNINNMDNNNFVGRLINRNIEEGRPFSFNSGNASNRAQTTVIGRGSTAWNKGNNDASSLRVTAINGDAINLGEVTGGSNLEVSNVLSGCDCLCLEKDTKDYFNDLQVMCRDFKSRDGIYMSKSKPRGLCIIFNIEKFDDGSSRDGSTYEAKCIKHVFEQLHFEVNLISNCEENNCNIQAIIETLEKTSKLLSNPHRALFVFFLSHGEPKGLICSDKKTLKFDEPIDMFHNNESTWKEIPKVFSFHCCRGTQKLPRQDTGAKPDITYTNTLVSYSTEPGM